MKDESTLSPSTFRNRSEAFSMSRWHCYWLMLIQQAPWVGIAAGILTAGLIVAGFIVSPWVGIAAIGFDVFIIVMCMSFVIFTYGFNSITGVNMPLHTLELDGDNIVVEFEDEKRVEISRNDCRPYRIYPGGVLVPVVGAKAGWLWIPPKAFTDEAAFQDFIKSIYKNRENARNSG